AAGIVADLAQDGGVGRHTALVTVLRGVEVDGHRPAHALGPRVDVGQRRVAEARLVELVHDLLVGVVELDVGGRPPVPAPGSRVSLTRPAPCRPVTVDRSGARATIWSRPAISVKGCPRSTVAIPPLTPPDCRMSPGLSRAVRRPSWTSVAVGPAASASSTDCT